MVHFFCYYFLSTVSQILKVIHNLKPILLYFDRRVDPHIRNQCDASTYGAQNIMQQYQQNA